ncbi:hypothetical protein Plhal703r1_c09g0046581 [Plasmopara halstedii]
MFCNFDALRLYAPKLAPTPTNYADLHRMWVPFLKQLSGCRYDVDLVRLPDEVTDHMIFDWFTEHSAPPTFVLPTFVLPTFVLPTFVRPTFVRNSLLSRECTVYFAQD